MAAYKQTKPDESIRLKVELAKRGWSWPELAEQSGLAVATLRNQWALDFPRRRVRLVIEHAGLGRPIWSTREEFKRRQLQIELFGQLAELIPYRELQQRAAKAGLPGYYLIKRKMELANTLTKFLTRRAGESRTRLNPQAP